MNVDVASVGGVGISEIDPVVVDVVVRHDTRNCTLALASMAYTKGVPTVAPTTGAPGEKLHFVMFLVVCESASVYVILPNTAPEDAWVMRGWIRG